MDPARRWLCAAPAVLLCLAFAVPARAALPFTVKSGHPRVDATPEAIARILALPASPPLNKANFPQGEGTVRFALLPSKALLSSLPVSTNAADSNATQVKRCVDNVFGFYSSSAYQIFLRHSDSVVDDPATGHLAPGCSSTVAPAGTCPFQLAFTSKTAGYAAATRILLPCDVWSTVRISWKLGGAGGPQLVYQVDSSAPVTVPPSASWPADWAPVDQDFVFSGREEGLDDVQLYSAFDPAQATAVQRLFDARLDEGKGTLVRDAAAGTDRVRLTSPAWIAHGAGHAVRLQYLDSTRPRATLSVAAEPLRDLMANTRRIADLYAASITGPGTLGGKTIESLIGVTDNGHIDSIRTPARVLSLAWLVDKDVKYRDALWAYCRKILAITTPTLGDDYAQNGRLEVLAYAYDALYPENGATRFAPASPTDTRTWRQALLDGIKLQLSQGKHPAVNVCGGARVFDPANGWQCTPGTAQPAASGGHDHNANHVATRAVLAVLDEAPELEPVLEKLYRNMVDLFLPVRAFTSPNGGHYFGWAYSGYNQLDGVVLWEDATSAKLGAPWMSQLVDFYAWALQGDGHPPAVGDYFEVGAGGESLGLWGLYSATRGTNGFGRTFHEDYTTPLNVGAGVVPYQEIVHFRDHLVPRAPLDGQPLGRHFTSSGIVIARDSWDYEAATVLSFKSTSFFTGNHQHLDQNSLTLHYKASLLMDTGRYDSYGSDHWHDYYDRTIAHNSLTVFDPAEKFVLYGRTSSNDGGQQWLTSYPTLPQIQPGGVDALDGVVTFEQAPQYVYSVGNASKAYSPSKLDPAQGFLRSVVFLPKPSFSAKPVVVVFDRVLKTAAKKDLVARVLWHSANEPEPLGGAQLAPGQYDFPGSEATLRNGGAVLFARTLLPVGAKRVKVGGNDARGDFRFLVADANGAMTNSPYCTTTECGGVGREQGAWRIEVSSPTPAQREDFLHVLAVADDAPGAAAPASELLQSADGAFVGFGQALTVGFASTPSGATSLTWATQDPTQPLLVGGLAASQRFRISSQRHPSKAGWWMATLSQEAQGPYTSSDQGVLSVEHPSACQGVTCPAAPACHQEGVCEAISGECQYADSPAGTACPGGTCADGACVPFGGDGGLWADAGEGNDASGVEATDASADPDAQEPAAADASASLDAGPRADGSESGDASHRPAVEAGCGCGAGGAALPELAAALLALCGVRRRRG